MSSSKILGLLGDDIVLTISGALMGKSMRRSSANLIMVMMLAACSKAGPPIAVAKEEKPASSVQTEVGAEKIAYTYSFEFKLPGDRISRVQDQHVALCDRLGPRCHVVSMEQAGDTRGAVASMELAVDSAVARPFGDVLVHVVERERGDVTGRAIQGENLTKQIVDVEARLQGRQALADRLFAVVKTQQGTIADLVAAQKALADVQQEIDTARAELAEARGRVAMSSIRMSYVGSVGLGGFTAPISDSFTGFGSVAGMSIGALLSLLAALLPWLIPIVAIVLLLQWLKRRHDTEE